MGGGSGSYKATPNPDNATLKDDDSQASNMAEMDPAMASLTQSLEELDRDVEAGNDIIGRGRHIRPRMSLSGHNSPVIRKTGPGSVPLLASTEDISIAVAPSSASASKLPQGSPKSLKKSVNPESYSTIV